MYTGICCEFNFEKNEYYTLGTGINEILVFQITFDFGFIYWLKETSLSNSSNPFALVQLCAYL